MGAVIIPAAVELYMAISSLFHVEPSIPLPLSFQDHRLMKPSIGPFFAFGSFFFGYILDVTKCTYQISVPKTDRPKMTRKRVMTGRPSFCTERRAAGVRIGASHSKAMVYLLIAFVELREVPAIVFVLSGGGRACDDDQGSDSRLPLKRMYKDIASDVEESK